MWSLDALFLRVAALFSVIELCPQFPYSHYLFLLPSKCTIISERTDVSKISRSHIEAFIEILWLYISRSQLRKKTTYRRMSKCIKSCKGSTFFFFFLVSSLLGNITLLCSSRPLIPFWTHKKEIINQEKEVLLEYYEWFISYFVNKIETIRAAEQLLPLIIFSIN